MATPHEAPIGGSSAAALADRPPALNKTPWSNAEDAVLLEQVHLHGGPWNWEGISAALPGRNALSCRLRWCYHLAPAAAGGGGGGSVPPFSAEEDAVIVACHRVFPNKWATIARFLPGRTANEIRHRCHTALRDQLAAEPLRRRQDGTLPLFPLVPGDVRTSVGGAVLRHGQPIIGRGNDEDQTQSGVACLELFPLAPGDLAMGRNNNGPGAAAMDGDGGVLEMGLWQESAAMAAFRAMVQAVRAP